MPDVELCTRTVNICPKTSAQIDENWDILQDMLVEVCSLTGGIQDGGNYTQDNTGANIPEVLIDPTTPVEPVSGDETKQQYDNGYVISIYDGTNWNNSATYTAIEQNANLVQIEQTFVQYFNQVNTDNTFSVDTGITGLVVGDIRYVEFIFNGAVQPDTNLLADASSPIGADYNDFSIVGTTVQIQTRSTIGATIDNDYAILKVVTSRSLDVIAV